MRRIILILFMTSCATPSREPDSGVVDPLLSEWRGTIYVGDHMRRGLVRAQSNDLIPVEDDRFSNMICIPYPDFTDLLLRMKYLRGDKK